MKFILNADFKSNLWYWKADDHDKLSDTEFLSFQGTITPLSINGHAYVKMPPGSIVHYRQFMSVKEYTIREEITVQVNSYLIGTEKDTVYVLNTLNASPITRDELFKRAEDAQKKALEYDTWVKLQQDSKPKNIRHEQSATNPGQSDALGQVQGNENEGSTGMVSPEHTPIGGSMGGSGTIHQEQSAAVNKSRKGRKPKTQHP